MSAERDRQEAELARHRVRAWAASVGRITLDALRMMAPETRTIVFEALLGTYCGHCGRDRESGPCGCPG